MEPRAVVLIAAFMIAVVAAGGLSSLYLSVNGRVRESYLRSYENCLSINEKNPRIVERYLDDESGGAGSEFVRNCVDSGGCFDSCGSICGPPKPYITLPETFEYMTPRDCPVAVCLPQCLYPEEYFY